MTCKNKNCLYLLYLKHIPLLKLCDMIYNNEIKCNMCDGASITIDDILNCKEVIEDD